MELTDCAIDFQNNSGKFRVESQDFFLTYPRCPADKQDVMHFFMTKCGDALSFICVSEEKHEDGSPHLHAILQFKKKKNVTVETFFDYPHRDSVFPHRMVTFHPNIQKSRDSVNSLTYVQKDGLFVTNGLHKPIYVMKKKSINRLSNKDLLYTDLVTLVDDDKIGLKDLTSLMKGRDAYFKLKALRDAPIKAEKPKLIPNDWGIELDTLCSQKKRHFWIYSTGTGYGKTTFADNVYATFNTYRYSVSEKYQDESVKSADFILLDGNHKVDYTDLETMCDGNMSFPIKYGGRVFNTKKPTVLVCTNSSIQEKHPFKYNILYERFNEINLSDYITVDPAEYWAKK